MPTPPRRRKLLPATKVARPDPLERRLYDGAALWCCTQRHPQWRVALRKTSDGCQPDDANDTTCPECGLPGQQISEPRTWTRLERRQGRQPRSPQSSPD
jgi:hypothetical protein